MAVFKDDKVAADILSGRQSIPRTSFKLIALFFLALAVSAGALYVVVYRRPKSLAAAARQVPAESPATPVKEAPPIAKPAEPVKPAEPTKTIVMPTVTLKDPAVKAAPKLSSPAGTFVNPEKSGKFGAVYAALDAGKADAAADALKALPAPAAGSTESKEALVLEGRTLLAQGKIEEARKKFEPLAFLPQETELGADALFGNFVCQAGVIQRCRDSELEQVSGGAKSWGAASALLEQARRAEDSANGDLPALEHARALYQQALDTEKLEQAADAYCLQHLNNLTSKIVLDPKTPCSAPKAVFHKVEAGDGVERIAKTYKVNQGQIKFINHLNDKLIVRSGQNLKMLPGDVTYKVNRTRLTGTLYIDGVFIRRYPVGIGPGNSTPVGEYSVERKVTNPDWYYDGKRIPFGDERNILGTRWMAFAGTDAKGAGLGIHGTSLPDSVPGRESKGCVRMHNNEVEEVYDLMPQGGKVEIAD